MEGSRTPEHYMINELKSPRFFSSTATSATSVYMFFSFLSLPPPQPPPTVCMCLQYWEIQHRTSHAKQVNYIQSPLAYMLKPLPWVSLVLEKLLHLQDNICGYRASVWPISLLYAVVLPRRTDGENAGWGSERCWVLLQWLLTQDQTPALCYSCIYWTFKSFSIYVLSFAFQNSNVGVFTKHLRKSSSTMVASLYPSPFCSGIKYTVELYHKTAYGICACSWPEGRAWGRGKNS